MQATLVQCGQYAQAVRNTSMLPNRRAHAQHFNVAVMLQDVAWIMQWESQASASMFTRA